MLYIPKHKRDDVKTLLTEYKEKIEAALGHKVFVSMELHSVALTQDFVLELVCDQFKVLWKDIISNKRFTNITAARHVYCYLMYHYLGDTFEGIGKRINRDHSSVLTGVRKIEGYLEVEEPTIYPHIEIIINRLNSMRETEEI